MSDFDPFTSSFTMLKMKYKDYDESITAMNFLQPNDKINVFINAESVFRFLTRIQDLENKIILQRDFDKILISNFINLIAHYKRFFVNNGLKTKVYLYHTDFSSDEFPQTKYNEDYRSYYLLKFNRNPKYILLSEHLKDSVLPRVKTICEFIPDVYYISTKDLEGSLVPFIIANQDLERKNLIISGELYDTQYTGIPNFLNHYIHRNFQINRIECTIKEYLQDMTKKDGDDIESLYKVYQYYPLYCSLISVMGDKLRSIDGIFGFNVMTLQKCLLDGLLRNTIQSDTTSPELIGEIFHDNDIKKEFVNNYYCSSIISMYQELSDAQKNSVNDQLIDRIDLNSLNALNATDFYHHPLLLEALF